jgi:hypothetical protein
MKILHNLFKLAVRAVNILASVNYSQTQACRKVPSRLRTEAFNNLKDWQNTL